MQVVQSKVFLKLNNNKEKQTEKIIIYNVIRKSRWSAIVPTAL